MRSYRSITFHRSSRNLPRNSVRPSSATTSNSQQHSLSFLTANDRKVSTDSHHAHPPPPPSPSPTSTVHIGTTYENLCAQTLPHLGFQGLVRSGGRSDRGIDLIGHWVLPSPSSETDKTCFHCIIQCKSHSRKPSPDMIRELEGAVAGAPSEWRGSDTIGVLCARNEATEGVRQAVRRSGRGVVWVMIELGGKVKQVLWNEMVRDMVGRRIGSGMKYVVGGKGVEKEVRLMLDGRVWEPGVNEVDGAN